MSSRVFVAGSSTAIGQALARRLSPTGPDGPAWQLVGLGSDEPDLRSQTDVDRFFANVRPEVVVVAAGQQAGILGNQRYPADLMIDNLRIASHVIPAAARVGTRQLVYMASSCTYPRLAPQPMAVESLWTGPVEPTSDAYATAKLAGMKLVEAYQRQTGARFFSVIAADVYGPGDDVSPEHAHVVGALLRRTHEAHLAGAPSIDVWGTGTPRREFMFVDDLADACVFALSHYDGTAPLNLGTGLTTSIAELATLIKSTVGYAGTICFDTSRPDGMPLKGLDSTPLRSLGWAPSWTLRDGLAAAYAWLVQRGGPLGSQQPVV